MEIRKLSAEEEATLSDFLTDIIIKEKPFSEAILINTYRIKEIDYVDIQFIKNDMYSRKVRSTASPIDKVVVRVIDIPSIDFHVGMNHYRERCNAMNLLNGDLIMDRDDEYYKTVARLAGEFGFGEYPNNTTFDPPLRIKKPE